MRSRGTSLLLLAVGLLVGAPAAADISSVSSDAFVEAFTATDGVNDRPPQIDGFDFATFDESTEAQTEGGRATARQNSRVTQTTDSVSVTTSGGTEISHCCTADDRPQTGAGANAAFSVQVCVDERSTFTASGNASVQSNGDESSTANVDICCDANGDNFVEEEAEDAPGRPRNVGGSASGILDPESGNSCVFLSVGNNSSLGSGQPSSTTTWTASLSVVSSPAAPEESDVFLWVAGSSGAFGDPESWDPAGAEDSGVPTFVDGVRQDAGVVGIASPVTMDLAGAALAGARGPRGPVQRRMGRLAVSRTASLRPVGGTLLLDNSDLDIQGVAPTLDGRSLEVGRGAVLNLDQGIVQARHVAIGSDGDGTLTVQGPDGGFSTLGRFGIGADSEGNVDITNGATVTSAETVLGELSGQGSARISGQGSLWQTGNLAVGLEDDASLTLEDGAKVESEQAFVDFGLSGDERARVVVQGRDASQVPSTWAVTGFLDIDSRGKVDVRDGGALSAEVLRIGLEGSEADCLLGQGCLDVEDGTATATAGIGIGFGGAAGKLRIGPNGRFLAGLAIGMIVGSDFDSRGDIEVVGPSSEDQLVSEASIRLGDSVAGYGELRLRAGAKARSQADVDIGTAEGSFGLLELEGDAGDPDATRFRVEGTESQLRLGVVSGALAEELVTPTGEIVLANGLVELVDADLEIARGGRVSGLGRVDGSGVSFVSNDGVIGCGVEIDAVYLQGEEGTLECPQAVLPPLPLLDPLSASAFARAVRARPVPPPPPPAGPFVVTGDATLAGSLVLRFLNGFAPSQGNAFPVLDVQGTLTGDFANVVVQGLAPGSFEFEPTTQDGLLTLTSLTDAVALPAVSLTGKTKLKEKKKALKLTVSREGDISAPLPVFYRVGGTATNGVDYQLLTGAIEIPARKKSVKLLVKPRRDGAVESLETIEIELLPGEGYSVGLFSAVSVDLTSADRLAAPKVRRR